MGGLVISLVVRAFLIQNARREVFQEADLMMASARSVRQYTSSDVGPLLRHSAVRGHRFLAETIPFFAATTTFNSLRRQYPAYTYREAALNPTNLADRADDWQTDIIEYLRNHPDEKRLSGERETALGPSMYVATPITAEQPCLECHGRPAEAPHALVAAYGSANGFGWQAGSIIGAEIVSVPMTVPLRKAREGFHLLLAYLAATLIATMIVLDLGVYFIVLRPLKLVSDAADRVSKGETNNAPLPVRGGDEIATLTAAFNRMQLSLAKALKMLE
ncbi:MAG TPA: DUF3365 domain-containing protein [Candidatus Aquilonibacter sp.]|nr:DUF3365 domain-containing protein [Candidatus Aquilonibacter sp.]